MLRGSPIGPAPWEWRDGIRTSCGVLQADAYGGFAKLYEAGADGAVRIREAACWAHLRRDFHDVWKATGSPIARDALARIGRLYDIERGGSPGGPPRAAARCARRAAGPRPRRSGPSARASSPGSPARASSPRPCATRSSAGMLSPSSSKTARACKTVGLVHADRDRLRARRKRVGRCRSWCGV
jgi:hypothetical protein